MNERTRTSGTKSLPRMVGLCGILFLLGAGPPPVDGQLSLAEIRGDLETTVASMPALMVRFTIRTEPHEEPGEQADPEIRKMIRATGPWGYRWAKSGERVLFTYERDQWTVSFDGRKAYSALRQVGRLVVEVTPEISEGYDAPKPDCLLGLAVLKGDGTLPEALRQVGAAVVGTEIIEGTPCPRIEIRGVANQGYPMRLTVWLDPAHDMLPRRLETTFDTEDPWYQKFEPELRQRWSEDRYRWETVEYFRVPNPVTGDESWFPKRAHLYEPWSRGELVVEEATIQASLPAERFRPPMPVGTIIRDRTGARETEVIVGGRKALAKSVAASAKKAAAVGAAGPPGEIDATPDRGFSWAFVAFVASGGLLITAAVAWWRLHA